jgi:diaminopimelate decarboxylase
MPRLHPGDWAAALDTGAYYFAHHYAYNSLPRPAVHGWTERPGAVGEEPEVRFATVRPAQTVAEIVAEGGEAHRDGLTGLADL